MNKAHSKNDLNAPVAKFCFELEAHRRLPDSRTRTAHEFLTHFFPHDRNGATDRVFCHMPRHVRAPILTIWGIRGKRSALMDDDAKVRAVVHDALVAGDIDAGTFEEGLSPDVFMAWVDLPDWWSFWRAGKIGKTTIAKTITTGYDLGLFDATWFFGALRTEGGKLRGTDVLAAGLSKSELTEWIRHVQESGDGSAKGVLSALGWEKIVARTDDQVLVTLFDALATKLSLVPEPVPSESMKAEVKAERQAEPSGWTIQPRSTEQRIDSIAAAALFKDDELIPMESGSWEGDDASSVEETHESKPRPTASEPAPHGTRSGKSGKTSPPPRGQK